MWTINILSSMSSSCVSIILTSCFLILSLCISLIISQICGQASLLWVQYYSFWDQVSNSLIFSVYTYNYLYPGQPLFPDASRLFLVIGAEICLFLRWAITDECNQILSLATCSGFFSAPTMRPLSWILQVTLLAIVPIACILVCIPHALDTGKQIEEFHFHNLILCYIVYVFTVISILLIGQHIATAAWVSRSLSLL